MLKTYEIVQSDIEEIEKEFKDIKSISDFDSLILEKENIENELQKNPSYEVISSLLKRKSEIEKKINSFLEIQRDIDDLKALFDIWREQGDEEAYSELEKTILVVRKKLRKLKVETFLSDEYDKENAILEITPGAGGTESMDWAEMLMRMYIRWAESSGFDVKIIDKMPGEQAGIKSATILIEGKYAYGYLKGESGIHRLVRISPFDANRRRHTSFAAVTVYPEFSEEVKINIDPKDLVIETFRASGPGGQHVNKTDSAVRIRHIPTGIVVTCQSERSQYRNKQIALRILQARLYELEKKKKEQEIESLVEKKDISWGNQIRSYILHPYKLVKDHRTGYETPLAEKVLEGEIDDFIEEYLKFISKNRGQKSGKNAISHQEITNSE